jgi:hypothetical protein
MPLRNDVFDTHLALSVTCHSAGIETIKDLFGNHSNELYDLRDSLYDHYKDIRFVLNVLSNKLQHLRAKRKAF